MTQDGVALWLGINWADQNHRWAMRIDREACIQKGEFEHTPEAVEQFVSSLALRFPGQRVAVALEQSRGALLFLLSKYAHLVLYQLHPNMVNHYRKSVYPSGAKSDPSDAALILELLCKHPEQLRPFQPDTVETRTLQLLVEARREAIDDKTRFLNRLMAQLKMFLPQVLDWFSTMDTAVVGQLPQKWPTLDKLQQASATKVAAFLREHRIPELRITALQQLIQQSVVAIRDTAVLEASVLTVRRMVRQIEVLRASIVEHDKRIAELAEAHPDYVMTGCIGSCNRLDLSSFDRNSVFEFVSETKPARCPKLLRKTSRCQNTGFVAAGRPAGGKYPMRLSLHGGDRQPFPQPPPGNDCEYLKT